MADVEDIIEEIVEEEIVRSGWLRALWAVWGIEWVYRILWAADLASGER